MSAPGHGSRQVFAACGCGQRVALPLRIVKRTAKATLALLPDDVLLTYRCRFCKSVVDLTARDIGLATGVAYADDGTPTPTAADHLTGGAPNS